MSGGFWKKMTVEGLIAMFDWHRAKRRITTIGGDIQIRLNVLWKLNTRARSDHENTTFQSSDTELNF